jgi:hypothetical protein
MEELAMGFDQSFLREHIEALSDRELAQVLSEDSSQYRPEALVIAKEEFSKRGLSFDSMETPQAADKKTESSSFIESVRVGTKAAIESLGAGSYRVAGSKIVCPICQHDQFETQTVLLNTRGLTFFKLDWLNSAATILTCSNCSLIQWFKRPPERE